MKLATHVSVGFSVAAALAVLLGCSVSCAWYAGFTAALINIAVDMLGHEVRGGRPRRTAFSHSLVGPLAFSLAFILPVFLAPPWEALAATISILGGAYTHLLLDAVTEGGIYPYWPLSRRRWRLAGLRYNHVAANTAAILSGALLLAAALAARGLLTLG